MYKYSVETLIMKTLSIYNILHTKGKIKMFIQPLTGWVKSLAENFQKPASYGSALEAYIVSKNPQDAGDVDRLMKEFDHKMSNRASAGWPV
jgi:hypothetical protein